MPLRQSMQRLAGDELLRYLSFECGAVGTVLGHGFHPLKARHRWSNPNPSPVHPEGRTPFPEQRCINDADENALGHGLVSRASSWGRTVLGGVGVVTA